MKELQKQIGKEFYYVSSGGLSNNYYRVEKGEVDSLKITDIGVIYIDGTQTYTKSGGKSGKKCFTDLRLAKNHAQELNEKRYLHNKELIEKDDRYHDLSNPID